MTSPRSQTQPLGVPLPPTSLHSVSVSMPTWQSVVGYEEGDQKVHKALQCGYPRFKVHPHCEELIETLYATHNIDREAKCLFVFPTLPIAQRCSEFVLSSALSALEGADTSIDCEVLAVGVDDIHAVVLPTCMYQYGKSYWQHTGEILSSRYAKHANNQLTAADVTSDASAADTSILCDSDLSDAETCSESDASSVSGHDEDVATSMPVWQPSVRHLPTVSYVEKLKARIGGLYQVEQLARAGATQPPATAGELYSQCVDVYPSGMAAIFNAHRIVRKLFPARKSVMFGFPYLDTLKILQRPDWGPGCHFFPRGDDRDYDALEALLATEKVSALFVEFPGNPLLVTPRLKRLSALAKEHGFLLVVDDTIGSMATVNVLRANDDVTTGVADIAVCSLTKSFSGTGNVMGGSLVVNPLSPFYRVMQSVRKHWQQKERCALFEEDAQVLYNNSNDYVDRARVMNRNATLLANYLKSHPLVKELHFPKWTSPEEFSQFVKACGGSPHSIDGDDAGDYGSSGYGSLMSIVLHSNGYDAADANEVSCQFYDNLSTCKGPSLGTNFTLCCPYTLLAHYTELPFASECGVNRNLIRVSVGVENIHDIIDSFENAFHALESNVNLNTLQYLRR
eukprot:GFYU01001834.1.p1 GENE.GFYU01001834.1~~GFYU01001834.1.p1  ORF type:complete len:624 (+),score=210.95 GFYU01001834.1:513-2384(+)